MSQPDAPRRPARASFSEIMPLFEAIPFYGPPALLFGLPWILLVLLLVGPFAVLMTIVIVLLAARLLILALAGLVRSLYRLVRHVRSARAVPAIAPAGDGRRVAARREQSPRRVSPVLRT
jgi:hypothetical protein